MEVIRSVMAKELSWPGVNPAGVVDISFNCSGCWVALCASRQWVVVTPSNQWSQTASISSILSVKVLCDAQLKLCHITLYMAWSPKQW